MKDSMNSKLESLAERYDELAALLSDPETIAHQDKFKNYSKEYAQLEDLITCYRQYQQVLGNIEAANSMLQDNDPDMRNLADEELAVNQQHRQDLEHELQILLLPKDPDDARNIYLEIRAGTGGDEAAIFVGDLFRMYSRYAETQSWQLEVISTSPGEHGGFKEIISRIAGQGVYAKLKFESGAHRVQRVPTTEAQGRIHTSACTVAVMPEIDEVDEINISPDEIRVDTYRASGAGGQHVNKTDSAIRITHLPTGIVVECQDERSQHKNRSKAMSLLKSKILAEEQQRQRQQQAATRKKLVGSGDRSERIRTYNYPQGRLTDHRINLTLYKLPEILEGGLEAVIEPLRREHQAELLSELSDNPN